MAERQDGVFRVWAASAPQRFPIGWEGFVRLDMLAGDAGPAGEARDVPHRNWLGHPITLAATRRYMRELDIWEHAGTITAEEAERLCLRIRAVPLLELCELELTEGYVPRRFAQINVERARRALQ